MNITVEHVTFPKGRRLLMLSDVHGHANEMRQLLQNACFSPEDILILLGDFIEKGTQSLEVLRYVMALSKTHTVYPLMGNVDLSWLEHVESDDPEVQREFLRYSLAAKQWWGGTLLDELCTALGTELNPKTDMPATLKAVRATFTPELDFIRRLPTILQSEHIIFVHGGVPHENLAQLEGTDAYPVLKLDDFLGKGLSFHSFVVVGHWPVALYRDGYPNADPVIDRTRRIIAIDGGCGVKLDGQLNLLSLPCVDSEDFSFTSFDSLPRIRALENQQPSKNPAYIKWTDHQVTIIERGEVSSRVLFHDREMTVPTEFLRLRNGEMTCDDMTDYRLPVQKGDQLKLVFSFCSSRYVKKGSVTGWYDGAYQDEP